MHKYKVNLNFA